EGIGVGVGEGLPEAVAVELPPPQPAAKAASSTSGAAKAGFNDLRPRRGVANSFWAAKPTATSSRRSHIAGGGVLIRIPGTIPPRATVDTMTFTASGVPGVTVTRPAGPLQEAFAGAPVQLKVTENGLPVAASCRAKVATCPALTVVVAPFGAVIVKS